MNETYADSFFFMALLNRDDEAHALAREVILTLPGRIVTTDWVLAEVGDAFCTPAAKPGFLALLESIRRQPDFLMVLPEDNRLFEAGLRLFAQRPDKAWSLTDCISFAAMQERGIRDALTGDHHFEQAGFVALLK